ncbi:MAG: hypothetical protein ACD_48C00239G0001 [uncultured bacterium]|nr:MAG: hypothetical protein ACD_48C00239G0001 [uncultured bacterium]
MIQIADKGNTMLRVATGGVEVAGGTRWTVYPEVVSDPTLQKFDPGQQNRIRELSITDLREKEDVSGHGMNENIAEAIVRLKRNLDLEQYKDLGLVADRIDVDPKSEIAKVLETEYGIKSLEKEIQTTAEVKG